VVAMVSLSCPMACCEGETPRMVREINGMNLEWKESGCLAGLGVGCCSGLAGGLHG
jgi:hypothetical protein